MIHSLLPIVFAFSCPAFVASFSFVFQNAPTQCQNLSVAISGKGVPPYSLLIVPFGSSPLPNNVEARIIVQEFFPGLDSAVTFRLNYPANSQFVAVASDSTGFGSGGTSVAGIVQYSPDASCFNSAASTAPAFTFSINPPNQIVQCSPTRLAWDPTTVVGTVQFLGVIPGGQSFGIGGGPVTNVTGQGTGFSWTPSVRGGTTLMVVAGDSRGNGTGGSVVFTVSQGDNSCLTNSSPSSTPGSPAGGSYATSTSVTSPSSGNGSSDNTPAIVGGIVGGLVLAIVALLVFLFMRRRKKTAAQKERPIHLLQGEEHENPIVTDQQLPQYYQPEPFLATEPTSTERRSSSTTHDEWLGLGGLGSDDHRSQSRSSMIRSVTPDIPGGSTVPSSRKSAGGLRPMRPVNIIQHDDAGPSEAGDREQEPETIELPPAYTHIKK